MFRPNAFHFSLYFQLILDIFNLCGLSIFSFYFELALLLFPQGLYQIYTFGFEKFVLLIFIIAFGHHIISFYLLGIYACQPLRILDVLV